MTDANWDLQVALKNALDGDTTVRGLVQDIYDQVPEGIADSDDNFPYIVIGDSTSIRYPNKSIRAAEHDVDIHIWSRYRGMLQVKQIADAVGALLDEGTLSVTGHTVTNMRRIMDQFFRDPDGLTRHGISRYRIVTEPS